MNRFVRLRRLLFLCLPLLLPAVMAGAVAAVDTDALIRVGVLADQGEESCRTEWSPTIEYLNATIPDRDFHLVPLDFGDIHPAVENRQVDFILVNSSFYVGLEIDHGVSPVATLKNLCLDRDLDVIAGAILRRADRDDIEGLEDLRGKRLLAVESSSFGVWHMAWRELKRFGIDPYEDLASLDFYDTHDAVVMAVLEGRADAGAVRAATIERMAMAGKIDIDDLALVEQHYGNEPFPFLHSTDHYPEWPLAKLAGTNNALAADVAVALLRLERSHPAAIAARCAGWTVPRSYDPVHACLRELKIGPYANYGEYSLAQAVHRHRGPVLGLILILALALISISFFIKLTRRLNSTLDRLRKEAEERGLAEERLAQALHGAAMGSWFLDIKNQHFQVNEDWAEHLGFDVASIPPTISAWCALMEEGAELSAQSVLTKDRSDTREGTEQEYRCRDSAGHFRWILDRGRVVEWDGEGEALHAAGTFLDVTARKQMEIELAQARKLESMGQLAAGIAHEINTPSQFIGDNLSFLAESCDDLFAMMDRVQAAAENTAGGGETLRKTVSDSLAELDYDYLKSELPDAIRQSIEGVDRVRKIVRAMKDFSHPGSDHKEACNINDAIASTVTVARNEWKYLAELELDLDENLPPVTCLVGELKQVILNLVVNAAHAINEVNGGESGQLGHIGISTRFADEWAEIRIADTGGGIPAAIQDKIFEPFFTTKAVGKGTGQGLAIAHNSVTKNHGGELSFESTSGEGTTFLIRLPLNGQQPTLATTDEDAVIESAPQGA